jgi:NADH dehydrogenase [ubiquinone] 1 alpha subcomplex assembly factor 7
VVAGFRDALEVHLIEASPFLRKMQQEKLAEHGEIVHWHESIDDIPHGPVIIIANEFFDALPACQYVRSGNCWHERLIGADRDGRLQFGLAPETEPLIQTQAKSGTVLEVSFAAYETMQSLAEMVVEQSGAMLVIDYGHVATGPGETLQALRHHEVADPLANPGEADLTVHVDFANLARAARIAGAEVSGPVIQADFLMCLGLFERAAGLKKNASMHQAKDIDRAILRLVGTGMTTGAAGKPVPGMGALFKVLGISNADIGMLPGFEAHNGTSE